MSGEASPVLDPATIADLRRAKVEYANPLLIRRLVEIYRTNAPKRIEQLRAAVASGDAKTLGLVAHTLKTNCAMLGATAMSALCATLEGYATTAAPGDAAVVLSQLESEFARVLAALATLLSEEPS